MTLKNNKNFHLNMKENFQILNLLLLLIIISAKNQYYLSSYSFSNNGAIFNGTLSFKGEFSPSDYHYDWTRNSDLLVPIKHLYIKISLECDKYLHFYITDANQERWEHPYSISDSFKEKIKQCSKSDNKNLKNLTQFGLYINENPEEPFYISLTNPNTKEIIFTTQNTDFLYTDCFIGFGGYITSNDIYGFGERYHELKLGDGKFTSWPNDTCGLHQDTGKGGYNAWGIHPLGFHKTYRNTFVGLLFNNINAQDLIIQSHYDLDSTNNVLFEHRTIGGVIDYYLTLNENPEKAILSIHEIIGHPTLPPFWSLGFHQCKFGYESTKDIINVYEGYIENKLPIDTFWGDIDILQDGRIFTLNQKSFYDLPVLIEEMHKNNYKFIPIVDIGFPVNDLDEFYLRGKKTNAFIKSSYTGEDLLSNVWPGKAVFPDFFCEEAEELWGYAMEKYYEDVKYDGLWLDMNEPTMVMASVPDYGEILPEGYTYDQKKNPFSNIPYIPGYRENHHSLTWNSLAENSYSKLITENKFLYGYNFKPLISLLESRITNKHFIKLHKKRPFILSRSTSLGHGNYGFHWLGDNYSQYKDMKNGLNGIFQFQIYGIPMVGDDICGFNNDSWDTLCARWMTLGAFFPFARNHNCKGNIPQEPFAFGSNSKTLESSKKALDVRYSLLRYFYTEIFKISIGIKAAFFKPVFFEYYFDKEAYRNADESFMLGESLIVYPIFSDEVNDVSVYIPKGDWYKYPTGEQIRNKSEDIYEYGGIINLSGEFNVINIFMKGGKIIPYQDTFSKFIPNSHKLNEEPTELIIIPDTENYCAEGDLIFDDDSYDTLEKKNYYYINIKFEVNKLYFNLIENMKSTYNNTDIFISKLKFFNMKYIMEEKYDILIINLRNGKRSKSAFYFKDNNIEVDLTFLNIKFYEINNINFGYSKYKSNSY